MLADSIKQRIEQWQLDVTFMTANPERRAAFIEAGRELQEDLDEVALAPRALVTLEEAAFCGNSVYHDDCPPNRFDERCGACVRSLTAIQRLLHVLSLKGD